MCLLKFEKQRRRKRFWGRLFEVFVSMENRIWKMVFHERNLQEWCME